ncbi:Cocosin 1 [Camellia lanceoleosa]|uniref:Cocosin 1 n=2 Tax=Camellia lanceoleosa TaxID=1840588 RepID=A0ACC0H0T7_9ERIC|nr:Cocosin 1 [Camellia lanceoleosa]KAI8008785.1 Cocosin 1 [Camellia lanceoleosa]
MQCAGVAATRHQIESRGLLLPSLNNAPMIVYILQSKVKAYSELHSRVVQKLTNHSDELKKEDNQRGRPGTSTSRSIA